MTAARTYERKATNRVDSFSSAQTSRRSGRYSSTGQGGANSSFSRFATPVDYWEGSTALDFAYWDDLSSSELNSWGEVTGAKAQAASSGAASRGVSRKAGAHSEAGRSQAWEKGAGATKAFGVAAKESSSKEAHSQTKASAGEVALPATARMQGPVTLAICVALLIVCLAVVSFVRIGLSSDTVLVQMKSQELSETIASTRSAGKILEVQKSAVSNASHIRSEAIYLGMVEPLSTESLILEPDTVTVDEAGNLSLSGSVAKVATAA